MLPPTYGEMSRHLMLGRQSAHLKDSLATLSKEMTSGVVADRAKHLRGNLVMLSHIERTYEQAATRKAVAQGAGQIFSNQQSVINTITTRSSELNAELLMIDIVTGDAPRARAVAATKALFADTVQLLNTTMAGRSLFAGQAGDSPALAPSETILSALLADLPSDLDPVALSAHVDGWFAQGGGFDSSGYLGGSPISASLALGHATHVGFDITAEAMPLRQTLAGLAKGALLARGVFDSNPGQQAALLHAASRTLAVASVGLVNLSAQIGIEEEKAARAVARAEAEQTVMSIARAEMISVDPYDSATRLEHSMSQLDLLYALTARLSRLRLSEYLR